MNYRPSSVQDVDNFYSSTEDFCSGESIPVAYYGEAFPDASGDQFEPDGPEVADARGRF